LLNNSHYQGQHQIAICIALALAIHALSIIAFKLITHDTNKKPQTVEVVLLANQGAKSTLNSSSSSLIDASEKLVDTNSQSTFKTRSNTNEDKNTSPAHESKKNTQQLPTLNQSNRQQISRDGLTSLFSQSPKVTNQKNEKQVSTRNAAKLSDYQKRLIKHMLQGKLYDQFHRIMKEKNATTVSYTLSLWLLPSGAIKNAAIKETSGIQEIDKRAISAAYSASPYPKPPPGDTATRFKYEVPVQYKP